MSIRVIDARKAYGQILTVLRTERQRRVAFLTGPLQTIRLAEIDRALEALLTLGDVVGLAIDANLLTGDPGTVTPEQAPLIDIQKADYP